MIFVIYIKISSRHFLYQASLSGIIVSRTDLINSRIKRNYTNWSKTFLTCLFFYKSLENYEITIKIICDNSSTDIGFNVIDWLCIPHSTSRLPNILTSHPIINTISDFLLCNITINNNSVTDIHCILYTICVDCRKI
jgi:hypothetical protein